MEKKSFNKKVYPTRHGDSMSVIPVFGWLRREDCKFQVSLGTEQGSVYVCMHICSYMNVNMQCSCKPVVASERSL
jgi:hypothetical protein